MWRAAVWTWSQVNVADPWLIAAGSLYGYPIVTNETRNGGRQKSHPSKKTKIPDIADAFKVKCIRFIDVLEALQFRLK